MLPLPVADPGTPPLTSPQAYLWWQARRQKGILALALVCGIAAYVAGALMPYILGQIIDTGLEGGLSRPLFVGCAVLAGVGAVQVLANVFGHRYDVENWLRGSYGSSQLIGHHATRTGDAITAELPTGEVVATVASDALRVGEVFVVAARFIGGIVAYVVVAVLMMGISVPLGLLVLIGMPLVVAVLALLVRPLQRRQAVHREAQGRLTTIGADTVSGLRILRGIGGEDIFAARYAAQSQKARAAGVKVAETQSLLDAVQTFLPGVFLTVLVWAGAHLAISGEITPGQLVTFYGFAAFLTQPLWAVSETMRITIRAVVGVRRILRVLSVPVTTRRVGGGEPVPGPPPGTDLVDEASGVHVRAGTTVALVAADPDATATVAARLGHLVHTEPVSREERQTPSSEGDGEAAKRRRRRRKAKADDDAQGGKLKPLTFPAPPLSTVRWGRALLHELDLVEVRDRVVVAESTPALFSGVLAEELDVREHADSAALLDAVRVADAGDVLESVPGGLAGEVEEKGRSLSGGQRQRVALARALLTGAEVLVLIEPTSAVDAHTEARIAERLVAARAGLTTVVVSTSPLVLDQVDEVVFVEAGVARFAGPHRELLRRDDAEGEAYRRVVSRAAAETPAETPGHHDPAEVTA